MGSSSVPNVQDAELVLKLYELRREEVMRASRKKMLGEFWPGSYEEYVAVLQGAHPLNEAYRQVSTYWEMAYSFARHGIVHRDFLAENSGEGIFLYAKCEPYLAQYRADSGQSQVFANTEWLVKHSPVGAQKFELFQERVATKLLSMR